MTFGSSSSWVPSASSPIHAIQAQQAAFSQCSGTGTSGGIGIKSADFGISSRAGTTSMFGSVTVASPLDTWSLGGTYSTGDSGRSLSLFSTLAPVDAVTYVVMGARGMLPTAGQLNPFQMLHLGTSAAILQLTDGPSKMSAAAILGGVRAAVAVGDRARTVG